MSLTLLLPWFPIILGVGVGGRLLGRARGIGLGILCALFWMALVQASASVGIWGEPWTVAGLMAGAAAIVAMGAWSGENPVVEDGPASRNQGAPQGQLLHPDAPDNTTLAQIASTIDQFDDWLEDHRNDADPWPKFDEFLRSILHQLCGATHAHPLQLRHEGEELIPLREPEFLTDVTPVSARLGIIGHVVTTGRSYIANDTTQGELVSQLAGESREPIAWCFAITRGTHRLGAVQVGRLDLAPEHSKPLLYTTERLVTLFWCTLAETCRSRSAALADPVSGLYTREAFLRAAEQSLAESYLQGEPAAAVVIALERLRELNDVGRWEVADELVREVSATMRRKVRMDDRLGRYDESRFVLLLRRVDSELASLIVAQIMSRLGTTCEDQSRWGAPIGVRCGVAGSGTEQPSIKTLVSWALTQCHRARQEGAPMASDLRPSQVVSGSSA